MGWTMPWYSAQPSLEQLLPGRELGLFHLVGYVRDGDRVFETYWTMRDAAVQAMDYGYALMDLTVCGPAGVLGGLPRGAGPQDAPTSHRRGGSRVAADGRLPLTYGWASGSRREA